MSLGNIIKLAFCRFDARFHTRYCFIYSTVNL